MNMIRFNAAKKSLAAYASVDDVKEYRDQATAIRNYAKMAGDKQLEIDAAEARLRSERRLGELIKEMPKATNQNGKSAGVTDTPAETLGELGIDKNLAKASRAAAKIDEDVFESILGTYRDQQQAVTANAILARLKTVSSRAVHVSQNTGQPEWYTPDRILDAARETLGGIDLDPASSAIAQKRVKAKEYYTAAQDGLDKGWSGRVWLNPPYSAGVVEQFTEKLCGHYEAGEVESAILLVNNSTETKWFQAAFIESTAFCFPAGRVQFLDDQGNSGAPLQGQALLYYGESPDVFADVFRGVGTVGRQTGI